MKSNWPMTLRSWERSLTPPIIKRLYFKHYKKWKFSKKGRRSLKLDIYKAIHPDISRKLNGSANQPVFKIWIRFLLDIFQIANNLTKKIFQIISHWEPVAETIKIWFHLYSIFIIGKFASDLEQLRKKRTAYGCRTSADENNGNGFWWSVTQNLLNFMFK